MKAEKKKKGEKGYLSYQKKNTVLRTVILFSLSLAIYLTGYISTGSNQNLLTIVAVLGCLPACRSAVNMIMILKYQGIREEDSQKIAPHGKACAQLWDLVFTSYEKNFAIHHMAFKGNCLIGYSADPSCDARACERHLHSMCVQNNLQDVEIKIFKELPKYINRLDQIVALPDYEGKDAREGEESVPRAELVCALMRAVSL